MILGHVVERPDLETAPDVVRCDRVHAHPGHEYVVTTVSPVVLTCPGIPPRRTVADLATMPSYAGVRGAGVVGHQLLVSAA